MKKLGLVLAAAAMVAFAGSTAMAAHNGKIHGGNACDDVNNNDICDVEEDIVKLNGSHYNLNIIGVDRAKESEMTGSKRHTIFVPLVSGKGNNNDGNPVADTKIWLTPGADFRVCDGNGFDEAFSCPDPITGAVTQLGSKDGATFQLPCNLNITSGGKDKNGTDIDNTINCDEGAEGFEASYEVWIRALGKPGGSAEIQTCAEVTDDAGTQQICSTENTILTRSTGHSLFTEVTDELTSIVVLLCVDFDVITQTCLEFELTRIALFSGDTEDWFWGYTNNGLRLAQIRFYSTT